MKNEATSLAVAEAMSGFTPGDGFDILAFEAEVEKFLNGGRTSMPVPKNPRKVVKKDPPPVNNMLAPVYDAMMAKAAAAAALRVKPLPVSIYDQKLTEQQFDELLRPELRWQDNYTPNKRPKQPARGGAEEAFMNMIRAGLHERLVASLDASSSMKTLVEDFEMFKEHVISTMIDQMTMTYVRNRDVATNKDYSSITIDIPNFKVEFRTVVDPKSRL